MRRIALSLSVLTVAALCTACSGGGSVLSTGGGGADRVFLTVAAPSNVARVLAGSGLPISATAVRGGSNGIAGSNHFVWSAAIVNGASYSNNTVGGTKPCAAVTNAPAAAGPFAPYAPDYSIYVTIDPTNEANIIFSPPPTIPLAAGTFLGPLVASNAYCATITATQGGATGSIVVAIVNPQLPQQ
ncbi:MAG: hypothetical protein ABI186_05375 [Candidatus Elarobacter sp.]